MQKKLISFVALARILIGVLCVGFGAIVVGARAYNVFSVWVVIISIFIGSVLIFGGVCAWRILPSAVATKPPGINFVPSENRDARYWLQKFLDENQGK